MKIQFQTVLTTYEQLRQKIDDSRGVLTIRMSNLRNIHGNQRLGLRVRSDISKKLAGQGLKHYPSKLTNRQDDYVRIYKGRSAVADMISAVLKPSPQSDKTLRQAASQAELLTQ
jgi:hypothetical protein